MNFIGKRHEHFKQVLAGITTWKQVVCWIAYMAVQFGFLALLLAYGQASATDIVVQILTNG